MLVRFLAVSKESILIPQGGLGGCTCDMQRASAAAQRQVWSAMAHLAIAAHSGAGKHCAHCES